MKERVGGYCPPALCLCLVAIAAVLAGGCRSPRVPESKRAAAVILTNHLAADITAATRTVFQSHDFEPARASGDELVFQKPGTFMNSFVYGDWLSSVWQRVKVYQRELDSNRTLLDCDLYMVQQADDPFFQKERRLGGRNGHCQDLLDEVAATLNRAGPGPPPGKP